MGLSLSLSLLVCSSISHFLSLSLSFSHFLSLSLSFSLFLSLSLSFSHFLSLSLTFSLFLSLSLFVWLTFAILVRFASFFRQTRGFKGCSVNFFKQNFKILKLKFLKFFFF